MQLVPARPPAVATARPSRPWRARLTALVVPLVLLAGTGACRTAPVDEGDLGPIPPKPTTSGPEAYAEAAVVEDDFTGSGPKAVVLGDTILHRSLEELRPALGDYSVKVAAVVGEGLVGGPFSAETPAVAMREVARAYGADAPDVAVLGLGTYDALGSDRSVEAAEAALAEIVEALGARCLVTVTLAQESPIERFDGAVATQLNVRLREVADQVVDWQREGSYPGFNDPNDALLPTEEGSARLAELVAEAVGRCGAG